MTQRTIQRVALVWIAVAAAAIPVRMRGVPEESVYVGAPRIGSSFPQSSGSDATANLVEAAISANLFGLPRTRQGAAEAQEAELRALGSATTSLPRRLRLSAIVGPPWRAVIETEGDRVAPIVLEAGDSMQAYRVVRIVADSIVLRKNRETIRRLISQSWIP